MKNNEKVLEALKVYQVKQWQLAEKLGIRSDYVSRRLKCDLPNETMQIWLRLIKNIAKERRAAV